MLAFPLSNENYFNLLYNYESNRSTFRDTRYTLHFNKDVAFSTKQTS